MQYAGYLAPLAFVLGLAAFAQIGALRKELASLREIVNRLSAGRDPQS